MTSTLKTKLSAFSDLQGLCPSGTPKFGRVEVASILCETGHISTGDYSAECIATT